MIKYESTPNRKDAKKHLACKRTFVGLTDDNQPIFEVANPAIKLTGTVKLHGSHGDVVKTDTGFDVQSRNRVLTVHDDNYGFASFVEERRALFLELLERLPVISGEFVGGNIQAGIALTGMDKAFIHFHKELGSFPKLNVWCIYDFLVVEIEAPLTELDEHLDYWTDVVDNKCPVGMLLNPNRTNDIGEGWVWKTECGYKFKTKGEQHARGGGVKAPRVEKTKNPLVDALVQRVTTVDRLEQGIEFLQEMSLPVGQTSTGHYLKWVAMDVQKEEDLEGLPWKDVCKGVQQLAKAYFMEKCNAG